MLCKSLNPNFSQFFRRVAAAMLLKNCFNLKFKHIQIILTYVLIHFIVFIIQLTA